jgi:hypothetical protein
MKQFLFTTWSLVALHFSATAQIIINRTDVNISQTQLDSAAWKRVKKDGAVLPTWGNNQIWDYSTLRDSLPTINKYYNAPALGFGTPPPAFADATHAFNYVNTFQVFSYAARAYLKMDATGYYQLGYATNGSRFSITTLTGGATDSILFPAAVTRLTTPWIIYKFPMTANTVWKSNFKDTAAFQLSVAAFGLNKAPGMRVSKTVESDSIVGWGTLKQRNPATGGVLNFAVLLRQRKVTVVDSFYLNGAPAPDLLLSAFGLTQGNTVISPAEYDFLAMGFNEPLMYFSTTATGAIQNITRAVSPNLGLVAPTQETKDFNVVTKVYPNPATEAISFEFQKTNAAHWNIMLYDMAGKILSIHPVTGSEGIVNQRVEFNTALPNGTYFYNLLDETALIRASGKVVVNR